MVLDGKNCFRNNIQVAFEQEVVNADDGPSQGIFDRCEEGVGCAFGDGPEGGIKRCTWNGDDVFAQELNRGGFAESTVLALEGDPRAGRRWLGHGSFIVITVCVQDATLVAERAVAGTVKRCPKG